MTPEYRYAEQPAIQLFQKLGYHYYDASQTDDERTSRWGSCTKTNEIIINIDTVKLPFSLIDYIVVHELCHLEHKGHTKAFWREVEKYIPAYRELESRLSGMRC